MRQQSFTKDESFLCKLASMAEGLGSSFHSVDCYLVGQAVGQNKKSTDNIVRMLAQTNFIHKLSGYQIALTKQGKVLVDQLQESCHARV